MLLGFEEYETQSRRLAKVLDLPYEQVLVHRFPDGESKVTLPADLPPHVVFCRSLDHPNDKLVELLLAANTARQLGAKQLTLVAPYLCYMRQDIAFSTGESVSQLIIGRFLASLFDNIITVDPHLHRTHDLIDAIPANHAIALSANTAMCDFLSNYPEGVILLGPDSESAQWVRTIAEGGAFAHGVANKKRVGDREIRITLPDLDFEKKSIVIVDDVISSGETVATTAQCCFDKGARSVNVLVAHPLFAQGAIERLQQVGVGEIWSTDSIPHTSNRIALTNLLAEAVHKLY